jgi:hypothetical protein
VRELVWFETVVPPPGAVVVPSANVAAAARSRDHRHGHRDRLGHRRGLGTSRAPSAALVEFFRWDEIGSLRNSVVLVDPVLATPAPVSSGLRCSCRWLESELRRAGERTLEDIVE